MKIVNVIPLKKGILKNDLTYFTLKDIEAGSIVSVNLRSKKTLALAVSCENVSDSKINIKGMDFNLKKILEVKDRSIFLKEYIEATLLVSKYFASSKSNAIATLIPALYREEYDKITKFQNNNIKSVIKTSSIRKEKLLLQETFENRISIYKTLIRENFAKKKSVFVVLPTESDIEVFKENISHGIEQFTQVIHSGYSSKKILDKTKKIMENDHPVLILGTAQYLSIPRPDLGLIILEHESSTIYNMINTPHFDLRIFVEIFASKLNVKLILSDTLLRFETIARRDIDGLVPMHQLLFRFNFNKELIFENPRPKIEDNFDKKNRSFQIFSIGSIEKIRNSISRKENVFIFTLRKGLATSTICGDCAEVVSCKKCLAPLVLYSSSSGKKRMFVCNRCGEEKDGETKCINCNSWNLVPLGIGTETVFEELSKLFPDIKILRFDKESIKNKTAAEKTISDFEGNPGSILVGTEMATRYMRNNVSLSLVASFDSFWSIPNFKMSERIIQLIISIISKTEKTLVVQTKNDKDPILRAIQSGNLLSFIREELSDRKNLDYPPYKRFIKIKYLGDKSNTLKAKEVIADIFSDYDPLIFSGFIAQAKEKYVTNALIKIDPEKWSVPEISLGSKIDFELLTKLLSLPSSFEIIIDPEDLL